MENQLKRICGNCGAEYYVGTRCPCLYVEMDNSFIKPLESEISDPFRYFRTFLENRNPYCFLYQFYRTEGLRGYIDETRECIWTKIITPDGKEFIENKPNKYEEYVERLFSRQLYISQGFVDELIYDIENQNNDPAQTISDLLSQLESLVKVEKRGAYNFSVTNVLGESWQVREVYIKSVQTLIDYVIDKKSKYIKSNDHLPTNLNPNKKKKSIASPTPLSLTDIIVKDKIDMVIEDLKSLEQIGYFKIEGEKYIFDNRYPYLVAIAERWKEYKWLLPCYQGYKLQRELSNIMCGLFGLDNNKESVYSKFKPGFLFGDTAETRKELSDGMKVYIKKINRGLEEVE